MDRSPVGSCGEAETSLLPAAPREDARAWSACPATGLVDRPAQRPVALPADLPYGRSPLPAAGLVPMPLARSLPPSPVRRSATAGVLASLVLPGTGSMINGSPGRGAAILSLWLFAFLLDLTLVGAIIGLPLGFVAWLWGIADGAASADRYNLRHSGRPAH